MRCYRFWAPLAAVVLVLGGCQHFNQPKLLLSKKGAVELRAMQSRQFEISNAKKVYRAVIATFQDLGYSITKVEPAAGMVSANKLSQLKMTASVFKRGKKRIIVRSNAVIKFGPGAYQGHQVDSPKFYQQRFFEPLSKALFLTALQVEDKPDAAEKAAKKAAEKFDKAQAAAEKEAEEKKAAARKAKAKKEAEEKKAKTEQEE